MRKWICTVATASLLLPVMAVADQSDSVVAMVARRVPAQAFEAQILLIGETHRKPRSHALTWVLIQRALSHHDCVHFALEVPADGKTEWRRAATQPEAIEQIGISPIHDSPSLRRLMVRTSELARHACLGLHPIDEPAGYDAGVQDRDKYMARQLTRLAKTGKFIIALLGSNHAVRHLDWKDDFQDKPVAQLVSEAGVPLYVLVQDWVVGVNEPRIFTHDSEASIVAMNSLLWSADVNRASRLKRYADMLVQWPGNDRQ